MSRQFYFTLTYGLPIFCHVCSPFVESDDQRLSFYVTFAKLATLSHASRRGVWCRVLYGVLRTHSTFHDEDSLSDKGNRLGRLGLPDRLFFSKPKVNWLLHIMWTGHGYFLFLHAFTCKVTKNTVKPQCCAILQLCNAPIKNRTEVPFL
jgi:hypothetical protein